MNTDFNLYVVSCLVWDHLTEKLHKKGKWLLAAAQTGFAATKRRLHSKNIIDWLTELWFYIPLDTT